MSREKNWQNKKRNLQNPKEKDLRLWRNNSVKDTLHFFEGDEIPEEIDDGLEQKIIFGGFLVELRNKGIRVSTPEWMHFLTIVQKKFNSDFLKNLIENKLLFETLRMYAKVTLVKDKADEAIFNEVFDEYFFKIVRVIEDKFKSKEDLISDEEEDPQIAKDLQELVDLFHKEQEQKVEESEESREGEFPKMEEKLGIDEVDENLDIKDGGDHEDEEVHGGKEDQHNDILKKADKKKVGGGKEKDNKDGGEGDQGKPSEGKGKEGDAGEGKGNLGKAGEGKGELGESGSGKGKLGNAGEGEGNKGKAGKGKGDKGELSGMGKGAVLESEMLTPQQGDPSFDNQNPGVNKMLASQERGILKGGGKGKSRYAERVSVASSERLTRERGLGQRYNIEQHDRRKKYERRPEKGDIKKIIRSLRKIISDVSQVKSGRVDVKSTVRSFARKNFRIGYEREREKQQEIVLLVDVGGPVDEWSPIIKEVAEEMTKGLSKLKVYLFHNNLYGYVWEPDKKNFLSSSYAKPNSLIDIKSIVRQKKKVIIYGDAEMSYSEFEDDHWAPNGNQERVDRMGMKGDECLKWIKQKAKSVVWINPIFSKEWEEADDSGTIAEAGDIISMYDLSIGGVEDAIKKLMEKR